MNIQFDNAWILYLLWIVPLMGIFWFIAHGKREIRIKSFMSLNMQTKLRPDSSSRKFVVQLILITCGIFLMLIALARPQWGTKEYKVYRRGRDLIIALDVSRSMLANDTYPNRLQRAKTDIMDLIKKLQGDRAALLVFRHKAILRCPLTTDYSFLIQSLDAVSINSAPRGETDIGDAILKALDAFDNESGSHKAIILISDGEDLSGRSLDGAKEAGKRNIPIFTVGLGNEHGSKIPEQGSTSSYVKFKGKNVITKLDHKSLYNVAEKSGGAYLHAATANMDLGALYNDHLKSVSTQDLEETTQSMRVERFQLFLIPSILLILSGCFLSRGRLAIQRSELRGQKSGFVNKTTLKSIMLLLTLISISLISTHAETNLESTINDEPLVRHSSKSDGGSTIPSPVPPGREGARKAQKLYKKGKFEEAAEAYLEAAKGSTERSQRDFSYNAAISLYNAGKHKESADILREQALSESQPVAGTVSALGTVLYRAADPEHRNHTNITDTARLIKEAAEAFAEAARTDESRATAMDNLGFILKQLPEIQSEAKIAALTQEHEAAQATDLSFKMMNNQREIFQNLAKILTNDSPSQITQYENFAKLQEENSDLWIPLKQKMLSTIANQQNSTTNSSQQKLAGFAQHIDAIQSMMTQSADELRNLDPAGFQSVAASQAGIYHLWKGVAPYQHLLQEDIRLQSNTISETTSGNAEESVMMQNEALDLTTLFSERFELATPVVDQTNTIAQQPLPQQEELSSEDREKIVNYSEMAVTAQKLAAKHLENNDRKLALTEENKAYELLKEIEKLLPKQQQQNQQDQQQDQSQTQEQDQNPEEQKPEEQKQDKEEDQQEPMKPEDTTPEDIRKLLEKALEREKEHEAEKQRRENHIPMSPRERDW